MNKTEVAEAIVDRLRDVAVRSEKGVSVETVVQRFLERLTEEPPSDRTEILLWLTGWAVTRIVRDGVRDGSIHAELESYVAPDVDWQ